MDANSVFVCCSCIECWMKLSGELLTYAGMVLTGITISSCTKPGERINGSHISSAEP